MAFLQKGQDPFMKRVTLLSPSLLFTKESTMPLSVDEQEHCFSPASTKQMGQQRFVPDIYELYTAFLPENSSLGGCNLLHTRSLALKQQHFHFLFVFSQLVNKLAV